MAAGQLKAPPVFSEDDDYLSWKNDITVWQMFTDLDKKKQGPAVYLAMTGRAREAVREIPAAELGGDGGLNKIIQKLDSLFLKDESTRAYIAFKEFHHFKRSSGEHFADFIIKFEKLYNKLVKHEMALPEAVKAYFLLNAANMTEENEKLARTTCGVLDYTHMKNTIMKIFGDPCGSEGNINIDPLPIKEECFIGRDRYVFSERKKEEDGKYRKRKPDKFKKTDGYDKSDMNPVGQDGNILRCFRCDSTRHLASKCPHRNNVPKSSDVNEVHITLFASSPDEKQYCLIGETLGRGVLDSGCTKTVSGELWMEEYLSTLPNDWKKLVKTDKTANSMYRFGDGKESKAVRNVVTPVAIGNKQYMMSIDVVKNDIPLLISKRSMKSLGMKLNFLNDTADIGDKAIPLICSTTGHYSLPLTKWDLDVKSTNVILHTTNFSELSKIEKA